MLGGAFVAAAAAADANGRGPPTSRITRRCARTSAALRNPPRVCETNRDAPAQTRRRCGCAARSVIEVVLSTTGMHQIGTGLTTKVGPVAASHLGRPIREGRPGRVALLAFAFLFTLDPRRLRREAERQTLSDREVLGALLQRQPRDPVAVIAQE